MQNEKGTKKPALLQQCTYRLIPVSFERKRSRSSKAGFQVALVAQHDKDETVDGIAILRVAKPKNRIERMTITALSAFKKALWEWR